MKGAQILLAFALLFGLKSAQAAEPAKTMHIRGTVTAVSDGAIAVRSRDGSNLKIALAPDWAVLGVSKLSLADIKTGSFVGVAAMPQPGGGERALEVLVFPEAARGANEGHYAWDLLPQSTMTNATVAAEVQATSGRELTLAYKGGTQKILVPSDVPVVTFAPDDRSLLQPGAAIFCIAMVGPEGGLSATRVLVGKDGLRPPM